MNCFLLAVIVAIALLSPAVNATPVGAPTEACVSMTPAHGFEVQSSPSPYDIHVLRVGSLIEVDFDDESGVTPFKGFLIQARRGNDIVGRFVTLTPEAKYLTCGYDQSSVTHVDNTDKSEQKFMWDPQGADLAGVKFFFIGLSVRLLQGKLKQHQNTALSNQAFTLQ